MKIACILLIHMISTRSLVSDEEQIHEEKGCCRMLLQVRGGQVPTAHEHAWQQLGDMGLPWTVFLAVHV